ncbi:Xaa-Pro dipeptidase [Marinilabiliaceae bacterium JC017]|nr:Xaa-Pro dipeptidase [Marinilabiliaceae bacterium JC017]
MKIARLLRVKGKQRTIWQHGKYTLLLCLLSFGATAWSQVTTTDYERAEAFLSKNISKKYYRSWVNPKYDAASGLFWYTVSTRRGTEFMVVNSAKKRKQPAFDQEKLAKALGEMLQKEIDPWKLPFYSIKLRDAGRKIAFDVDSLSLECTLSDYSLKKSKKDADYKVTEQLSDDKKYLAYLQDNNIWVKDVASGKSVALSNDGEAPYAYGASVSWYATKDIESEKGLDLEIDVAWSPDSRYLIAARYDRRQAKNLYLYKATPEEGNRAQVHSYERPLAGDSIVTTVDYVVIDREAGKCEKVDLAPNATFLNNGFNWLKKSPKAYQVRSQRGYKSCEVVEVDATTGKSRVVLTETSDTYVDPLNKDIRVLEDSNEFVWLSERDGWNHIYLYDWKTGKLKNQVTKGEFVVRGLEYVDAKARKIYFTAGGKEAGRDPYYTHLYVVNFDGTGMKLLSPENAFHTFFISPDKKYVVDNYSTVQEPNVAVLRRLKDGRKLMTLEQGDIKDLIEMGWQAPEPFVVKGRDGKTDIYGVLFKPANFDPNKKYPVIEGTYSGPQTIRAPKSFWRGLSNDDMPLSQLGFVMVNIDGLGSAFRSKAFHDFSYKNLGDIGAPDKIIAIKTMAEKYSWMDTTRVGIFGHSAGGYDAARALLAFGDFYKAGMALSGNHDHRSAKAWWPELYMGYPAGKHYDEQSNYFKAANLKGDLLIVHGEMDQNVNPTASRRFAAELMKANKDFELVIVPNLDHIGVLYNNYVIRKRWDFFVEKLMGTAHPKEYDIK